MIDFSGCANLYRNGVRFMKTVERRIFRLASRILNIDDEIIVLEELLSRIERSIGREALGCRQTLIILRRQATGLDDELRELAGRLSKRRIDGVMMALRLLILNGRHEVLTIIELIDNCEAVRIQSMLDHDLSLGGMRNFEFVAYPNGFREKRVVWHKLSYRQYQQLAALEECGELHEADRVISRSQHVSNAETSIHAAR